MPEEIDIFQSALVPKQEILPEGEKHALLEKLRISESCLPKIKASDPVVKALNAQKGDVIRIMRMSQTAGEYIYYRIVIP